MRSCHASAYGQWLHVNTTTVADAPSGVWMAPLVSGSANAGAGSPIAGMSAPFTRRAERRAERVAQVGRIGRGRDAPVTAPVDAAREASGGILRRLHVGAVDANGGRADEAFVLGL